VLSFADLGTAVHHFILASGANPDGLAAALTTCIGLRVPLTELLDDDSDGTAPNRLMQLLQPAWKAEWVVTASPSDMLSFEGVSGTPPPPPGAWSVVALEYQVPRRGKTLRARQSLQEVVDFQSACVLARTGSRAPEVQIAIDTFTQQFRWIQEAGRAVLALKQAGHFDHQSLRVCAPLVADKESIADLCAFAQAKRALIKEWDRVVDHERERHHFANFFTVGRYAPPFRLAASLHHTSTPSVTASPSRSTASPTRFVTGKIGELWWLARALHADAKTGTNADRAEALVKF